MLPLLGTVAGCAYTQPDPVVLAVEPDQGWRGEATLVQILGDNFMPGLSVEPGSESPDLDRDFSAWLVDRSGAFEDIPLSGVSLEAYTRIQGVVPPGLPTGLYDVRVAGPTGRSDTLPGGFTVSDSRADRLVLLPDTPSTTVNQTIVVETYLVDPNGDRVTQSDVEVEFWLEDATGSMVNNADFDVGGLQDPVVDASGLITGVLQPGGSYVDVTIAAPGTYVLNVAERTDVVGIDPAEVLLQWQPGDERVLSIELPASGSGGFQTVVGEPFDVLLSWEDDFGNPLSDPADALLQSDCSGFLSEVLVNGPTVVPVVLTTACDLDRITSATDVGSSTAFGVLPGPVDRFSVSVLPLPGVAGQDLQVQVVARDVYSNESSWTGDLTLEASNGGLVQGSCVKDQFSLGEYGCTVQPTVAGSGLTVTATGDDGTTGTSDPFSVLPSGAVDSVEVTVPPVWTAGQDASVRVGLFDPFGNAIDGSTVLPTDVALTDELGEVSCAFSQVELDGQLAFDCSLFTARGAAVLTADYLSGAAVADSLPITVINGAVVWVDVAPIWPNPADPGRVIAGQPFDVHFSGFDAWDNPTAVLADSTLDVSATAGALTPTQVVLNANGEVTASAVLTQAGSDGIAVSQGGVELGVSEVVTVIAGPTDRLRVTVLGAPWAWVGEATDLRVETVDSFENRTDWSGVATVQSSASPTPAQAITLTNGVGVGPFTWDTPAVDDRLDVTANAWVGSSALLDAVLDCGATGPVAHVVFGGYPEAVGCVDPVLGTASISVEFTGSTAGGAVLNRYGLFDGAGAVWMSNTDVFNAELPGAGTFAMKALVADFMGCGAEVSVQGYAGPDDGQPVGPLTVIPQQGTFSTGLGVVAVDVVGVTDCARDVASGAAVRVWADKGELIGPAPSGEGLELILDVNGDAVLDWSALPILTGGDSVLHAWVPSGAAGGSATVEALGDDRRPIVWSQNPAGEELGLVSEVLLSFSEPLLPSVVDPLSFALSGPGPVGVLAAVLENGNRDVRLTLDTTVDGSAGAWVVTASQDLRDAAGNRLDGAFAASASDYQGSFGDVGAPIDPVICGAVLPAGGLFRPDGDDGLDEESDEVTVELTAVSAPAWWEVSVYNAVTGELVHRERVTPVGGVDAWTWDGRDGSDRVVDNGLWTLDIVPLDGVGNRGTGCSVDVTVDNRHSGSP